jgi:hypothetical protein
MKYGHEGSQKQWSQSVGRSIPEIRLENLKLNKECISDDRLLL